MDERNRRRARSESDVRRRARETFWRHVDRLGLRLPMMHRLALVREVLGDSEGAGAYSADLPFRLYKAVQAGGLPRPTNGSPRILFGTIRGAAPLVLGFEGLFGRALAARGAAVSSIACDQTLDRYCDGYTIRQQTAVRCAICASNSKIFMQAFGVPQLRLGAFTQEADRRLASQIARETTAAELDDVTLDGLPLGRLVSYSLSYNACTTRLEPTPENVALKRGFLSSAVLLARAYPRVLDHARPDGLVMLNGMYMTFRILMLLAQRRGIPVYTYERGYRKHGWIFARDHYAARYPLDEAWKLVKDVPLSPAESRQLDDYLALRAAGGLGDVLPLNVGPEERDNEIWRELALDPRKPTATLFPNGFADTTTMDFDGAFASIYEFIRITVDFFRQRPDLQLVLRAHPAELLTPDQPETLATVLREVAPSLPPNVRYVGPERKVSSYRLIDLSRATLVYLSTVTLESALRGTPCLLGGMPTFHGRGFTVDLRSPDHYREALAQLPHLPRLGSDQVELARRFAYLVFFRYVFEFPWLEELDGWSLSGLALDSVGELAPGVSHRLDSLCDAILTGGPVPLLGIGSAPNTNLVAAP